MDNSRYEAEIAKLRQENDRISWRLVMAQSLGALLSKAYDALQAYGIDYRKLRTYVHWERLLPQGDTFDKVEARPVITQWLTQMSNDIDAAIRRKLNIKLHTDNTDNENVP